MSSTKNITNHSHHHSHEHKHSHKKKPNVVKLYLHRFAHSNAYVSIPILAITVTSYMLIGSFNWNTNYVAFIFFATLFLYPLHRLIGVRIIMPLEYSPAQKAVSKKPRLSQISVVIGFIGTLFFTFKLSTDIFQLLIPLAIISLTYSLPFIPTTNGRKRLRDIPGVKIYAISIVVTFTTSTIPLLLSQSNGYLDIFLLGIQRFLFILAITIPFDIRDVRIDKKWNLKTIPLLIGNEKSLLLSKYLLLTTSLITVFQFFYTDVISIYILIGVIISNIWTVYILGKFKTYNAPLFNAYMLEGTMVFQFAIVTIFQVLSSF